MALIEATSDYFSSVSNVIRVLLADTKRISQFLASKYKEITGSQSSDSPLNSLLIDHYRTQIPLEFEIEFDAWRQTKTFLNDMIMTRAKADTLYRTSSILLIYFCVSKAPIRSKQNSPLPDKDLQSIYSDLGLALYRT
jgi:hypothetical protein